MNIAYCTISLKKLQTFIANNLQVCVHLNLYRLICIRLYDDDDDDDDDHHHSLPAFYCFIHHENPIVRLKA